MLYPFRERKVPISAVMDADEVVTRKAAMAPLSPQLGPDIL
jgi:hypothetical protein